MKLQVRIAWQELAVIIDSEDLDLFVVANVVDDSKGLADPFADAFEVILRDFAPDVGVNEKPVDQAKRFINKVISGELIVGSDEGLCVLELDGGSARPGYLRFFHSAARLFISSWETVSPRAISSRPALISATTRAFFSSAAMRSKGVSSGRASTRLRRSCLVMLFEVP